jgi:hypothetical protein
MKAKKLTARQQMFIVLPKCNYMAASVNKPDITESDQAARIASNCLSFSSSEAVEKMKEAHFGNLDHRKILQNANIAYADARSF